MSWGELLSKGPLPKSQTKDDNNDESMDRDQDQGILYLPMMERRNVNGRFPIGREFGSYRKLSKRYPIAKRSPRPTQTRLKTTDPKVTRQTIGTTSCHPLFANNRIIALSSASIISYWFHAIVMKLRRIERRRCRHSNIISDLGLIYTTIYTFLRQVLC